MAKEFKGKNLISCLKNRFAVARKPGSLNLIMPRTDNFMTRKNIYLGKNCLGFREDVYFYEKKFSFAKN